MAYEARGWKERMRHGSKPSRHVSCVRELLEVVQRFKGTSRKATPRDEPGAVTNASKGSKGEPWAGKRLELTLRGFEGFEGPSKRFVHAAVSKDSMDKGYEGWSELLEIRMKI